VQQCRNSEDWIEAAEFHAGEFVFTIEMNNSQGTETFFLCFSRNDVEKFYPDGTNLGNQNHQVGYGPLPQQVTGFKRVLLVE